jgi:hypothetical protein
MSKPQCDFVIRKSSITGRAVWIGKFLTKGAVRAAYHRACVKERERIKNWGDKIERRRRNIMHLLNDCLDRVGFTQQLTREQRAAARQLQKMANENIVCDTQFYDHIVEDSRRREEIHRFRKKERENANNGSYV